MSIDHTCFETLDSLDALKALLASEDWETYLTELGQREDADVAVQTLRDAITRCRARLSPELSCPELQGLIAEVNAHATADPAVLRPLLVRIAALRNDLPLRAHQRIFDRLESALGQRFLWLSGGTGRSNRARRASHLFTDFAGQTHIAGAATDRHGNADGTDYDLGLDGAFEGHSVHVLQLYPFRFDRPQKALERKGFTVHHRTTPGKAADFADWLADADQLWLISTSQCMLLPAHIAAIEALWRRGGALYIWGDNKPFYADANAVLTALFGKNIAMRGDLPGGQVVHELADGRGFHPHLITTGLVHLFEGITVASLNEDEVAAHGFAPMMYGSAGNLITAVRDATPEGGPIVIDTAFTRLYCQWDDAGTARFVCNAGCFLGAALAAAQPVAQDDNDDDDGAALVAEGAFRAPCDLTGQVSPTWSVLSVGALGDALINTSDRVLTDPLSAGAANCVFSDAVYSETMGQWLLSHRRNDPLTGEPVVACLPLIDLSHPQNRRVFTEILCVCLMDRKYLPTAARLVFFAVVDQMLARPDLNHRAAWQYLYRQCLTHFTSTAGFDHVGEQLPLLEAMTALFSPATDDRIKLRRSFESVGVIATTLLREARIRVEDARRIARRARIGVMVRCAIAAEKAQPGQVPLILSRLLFDNLHGLPRLNGGRLVTERVHIIRDVSDTESRLLAVLGDASLLSDAERTVVLHTLLAYDLRQHSAEALLARMQRDSPAFKAVYDGEDAGDAVALLNQRFADYAQGIDFSDLHLTAVVPFATTAGPSVFRCVCGVSFGDPSAPLTEASLEALRAARVAHFRAVYRVTSPGDSWYPSAGSLHCSTHRAVQSVLKAQFADAVKVSEAMVPAVAAYLLRDGRGFLFDPLLERKIRGALASYLSLRRAGHDHPEGLLTLEVKARLEQSMQREQAC